MVKKNQVMITALALMIAVAGYLNFAGNRITQEEIVTTGSDTVETAKVTGEDPQYEDIQSMDSELVLEEDNYLEQSMDDILAEDITVDNESTDLEAGSDSVEEITGDVPGEAVFTSVAGMDSLSGAKLLKEQTRAKSKETFLEIINNTNIAEEQKQEAIDGMIALTDVAEKETAAEILLEAKGFEDVVVSITDDMVDVVVNTAELTEAQRAQIEDIVVRKTGMNPEAIVISTLAQQ
ncbi:MAG: SpoIIIAH-like family protein [Lachnospiraceae bacterium]|nr:SpoIIIAH-like family protein [Lachnospiraceae bacterium]